MQVAAAAELLGVNSSCSAEELKRAYHTASLHYHPDKNSGNADSTAKFQEVAQAYQLLTRFRQTGRAEETDEMICSAPGPSGFDPMELFKNVSATFKI